MTVLIVHWLVGPERLTLSKDIEVGQTIETLEYWHDEAKSVGLKARVEKVSLQGSRYELQLRYVKSAQSREAQASRSGLSTVHWDSRTFKGRAVWRDDADSDYSGTVKVVSVIGNRPSIHLKKSVSVVARPMQSKLRAELFLIDGCCVLSGETERQTLDAAHIVPVKANGQENLANAFLLRADLHRLFDAGLFSFDISRETAVVVPSIRLSEKYASQLKGMALPTHVFLRVKEALSQRAKLPGNRGPS